MSGCPDVDGPSGSFRPNHQTFQGTYSPSATHRAASMPFHTLPTVVYLVSSLVVDHTQAKSQIDGMNDRSGVSGKVGTAR